MTEKNILQYINIEKDGIDIVTYFEKDGTFDTENPTKKAISLDELKLLILEEVDIIINKTTDRDTAILNNDFHIIKNKDSINLKQNLSNLLDTLNSIYNKL